MFVSSLWLFALSQSILRSPGLYRVLPNPLSQKVKQYEDLFGKRNERGSLASIMALRLIRIAIHEETMEHWMVQATNLVFEKKQGLTGLGVDHVLQAKLMIAHFFGNQATLFQERIRSGKICNVNRYVMPVIGF